MKKTITFAAMHFSIAFSVTYLLTGSFLIGGLIAVVEPAVNTVAFYFHEKIWSALERKGTPKQQHDFVMFA
ncbi:DUF2061 domain-containing protein [Pseudoalteromonas pernae]|uniref:DUF2061 domain-containing protein n=1 Tax=Pseudoalteromonas pernae TaxID=3118054 RepID=UPI0032428D22